MRRFKVLLPVEINGVIHAFGSVVELDAKTAQEYSHTLMPVEEPAETKEAK